MQRILWVVVVVLAAAAGCLSMETWDDESEAPRRDWDARVHQPEPERAPAERTGNVRIEVEKISVARRDTVYLGSAWSYVDEHATVVIGGDLARRNGIRLGVAKPGFSAALQAGLKKTRNRKVEKSWITTLSGGRGTIAVGRGTYVDVLHYWTPLGRRVIIERAFVGSSLMVEPTILPGDMVRVRLYPRFTTRDGRVIDLTETATVVVVAHGRTLLIGGVDEASQNVGSTLFSWGEQREDRRVTLTVTPFIEGAP